MIYHITAHSDPGIYGTDEEGHPWATFTASLRPCHACGEMITSGWMRGRLGEAIYVCSKHVTATYEQRIASFVAGPMPEGFEQLFSR